MKLEREQIGRIAVSTIFSVVGAIALINSCTEMPTVMVWWLIYAIGSGVILNTREGETVVHLAIMSLVPAFVPVIVGLLYLLSGRVVAPCSLTWDPPYLTFIVLILNWFAIFLFSFARDPLLEVAVWLAKKRNVTNVEKVFSRLQLILVAVAGLVLALSSLGK